MSACQRPSWIGSPIARRSSNLSEPHIAFVNNFSIRRSEGKAMRNWSQRRGVVHFSSKNWYTFPLQNTHMVIEGDAQHLACPMTQRKTATHSRPIGELDLQNIGEDYLMSRKIHPFLAQLIGGDLAGFPRIVILLFLAASCQTIFAHHSLDAVLPCSQQRRHFPMPHGIVFLLGLFNAHGQGFIQFWTLRLHIKTAAGNAQDTGHLALVHRTVRSTQRAGQLHFVLFAHFPNSPRDFFRISFWTVSSPISFLRSSGDSPGSYPCALRRLCRSRWSANTSAPRCWNACLHRLSMEEDTPNFRQTSSNVVSRWKLSITTLNLNSGSYCLRFAAMPLIPSWFASFTVYFTRYGTG